MKNISIANYDNSGVLLGDNDFETGVLSLLAGKTVSEGAFLKRADGGKYAVITDASTETVCALYVEEEIKNAGATAIDYPIRALVAGKVRVEKCNVNGSAATEVQLDMLRQTMILPVKVTETGIKDNQ